MAFNLCGFILLIFHGIWAVKSCHNLTLSSQIETSLRQDIVVVVVGHDGNGGHCCCLAHGHGDDHC